MSEQTMGEKLKICGRGFCVDVPDCDCESCQYMPPKQNVPLIIKGTEHTEEFDKRDRPDREKIAIQIKVTLQHYAVTDQIRFVLADQILALIEPLIEETFKKGVRNGTTIRNIDWNSENHKRHGEKMVKAREEAKREEGERIFGDIDRLGLIEHTDSPLHYTGATILDCPACCWYVYKDKALKGGRHND